MKKNMKLKLKRSINQLESVLNSYSLKFLIPLLFTSFFLTGCSVVTGIFKSGLWIGISLTVLIIVLLIWGIIKIFKN